MALYGSKARARQDAATEAVAYQQRGRGERKRASQLVGTGAPARGSEEMELMRKDIAPSEIADISAPAVEAPAKEGIWGEGEQWKDLSKGEKLGAVAMIGEGLTETGKEAPAAALPTAESPSSWRARVFGY